MLALIHLVTGGVLGSGGSGREGSVRVLGDVLVGLLGSTRGGLLDLLGNGVDGVLNAVRWRGKEVDV